MKRIVVTREITYQGPDSWVDGTIDRMITEPTVMTKGLDGPGIVSGRTISQREEPVAEIPDTASVYVGYHAGDQR